MLTRSVSHGSSGIARAEHSRTDLTAPSFTFARPEEEWLRSWVDEAKPAPSSARSLRNKPLNPAEIHTAGFIRLH
jgi:hypothetical protein